MINPSFSTFEQWSSSIIEENDYAPLLAPQDDWKSWANALRQTKKYSDVPEPQGKDWKQWADIVYYLKAY